jgi:hypothetical protein
MTSSAPKARRVGVRICSGSGVLLLDAFDVELKVAEVILGDAELQHFVDDRNQVMKRADRLQRNGVGRTEDAARGANTSAFSTVVTETPRS